MAADNTGLLLFPAQLAEEGSRPSAVKELGVDSVLPSQWSWAFTDFSRDITKSEWCSRGSSCKNSSFFSYSASVVHCIYYMLFQYCSCSTFVGLRMSA